MARVAPEHWSDQVNEKTKQMLADAQAKADAAAQKWLKEKQGNIEQDVHNLLDQRLETLVAKLLGFNNRWGDWEIDSCNGRSGESAAGDWLRARAGNAAREWLTKQAGALPKLPAKAISSLRESYLKRLESELSQLLGQKAVEDARAAMNSMFNQEGTK